MDLEEIVGVVDRAWAEKHKILQHLEAKMPEVRERTSNLFKEMAQKLGLKS